MAILAVSDFLCVRVVGPSFAAVVISSMKESHAAFRFPVHVVAIALCRRYIGVKFFLSDLFKC